MCSCPFNEAVKKCIQSNKPTVRSRTDRLGLPGREWLREHPGVQQSDEIPLSASFGLEVPKDPAVGEALVNIQLRLDVQPCIVLESLVPCVDKIDAAAGTMVRAAGVIAFIAGANAVAVQGGSAIGHCSRPFADDDPVVDVGRVCAGVAAHELAVIGS